ncbi:hypothetical protein C8A03DRAFT_34516 [Achaetomium macrosporum]|uniref:Uncharacterized protein n=1 Tax=Achaetomium macrosporum TaxID=79813 RepID=A0AAN7C9P6_9PEZI|nr:hypothetical protein C8A03DRAFT_34516 [Achaetomium macrosporum]
MFFWRRGSSASKRSADSAQASSRAKRRRTSSSSSGSPDNTLKAAPADRWNPSIQPTSPKFAAVLQLFTRALRDPSQTIDSILASVFSRHEQELLRPCDARRNPLLAKMQEENRWRYAELLKTERFRDCAGRADLAFKFTLAWFGLPVASMGGGVEQLFRGWREADGDSDEDGSGEEGGEERTRKEALRFLNGYRERVYERDAGVRKPDPKLEAYYVKRTRPRQRGRYGTGRPWDDPPSLGLRGGEVVGDDKSDTSSSVRASILNEEDELVVTEPGNLSLRGGAPVSSVFKELHDHEGVDEQSSRWSSTDGFETSLYTPLGGFSAGIDKQWVPLYGYQGVVWFQMDLLYTFVDAVDRLLCLDNRAGVTYNLYLLDKGKDYSSQAERDEFLRDLDNNGLTIWGGGLGDYSHDQLAWEWAVDKLIGSEEENEGEQRHILFIAGPADPIPWTWEPGPSHRVMKVILDWANVPKMDRPDVAYLRMPENPRDVIYTNQFGPWMTNVCRVLAAGQIPSRPGYPPIPDAWFTVKGRGRGNSVIGTYGGLAFLPKLWETLVARWENDRVGPVTLQARTAPEHGQDNLRISDRWHLFLPGYGGRYEKQYILHDEVDDVKSVRQRIVSLLKSSMSVDSFSKIHSLEVHLPGAGFFIASQDQPRMVVSMTADDMDSAFQPVVDRLVHWRKWLQEMPRVPPVADGLSLFPQFITLRPVFGEYTICDADRSAEPLVWDPSATDVARFRRLVARLWSAGDHEQQYVAEASWVGITQGRPKNAAAKGKVSDPTESKPKLLLGPRTTEAEWYAIRSMIVEPDVFVSLVNERNLPRFGDLETKQTFGYRDIYQTPTSLLYHALEKEHLPLPPSGRHYDWQLWGEAVTPHLDTFQPWEEQPASLSTIYDYSAFSVQLLPDTGLPPANRNAQGTKTSDVASSGDQSKQGAADSVRFPAVTDVERGQRLREYSYAHPLDVQTNLSVPINAPPVDMLLNLRQDSVPVVSLSVLTPTEVRRLQRDYHDMRNLVLSRTERCPYPGCGAVYPANQPLAMQQHLQDKHVAEKCNFCEKPLFQHWPREQRYQHYVEKHSDILKSMVADVADDEVEIPDKRRTDRLREGRWKFCSRCGRDHSVLNSPPDRTQHDNVCYPGVQDREADWSACEVCGDRIQPEGQPHVHGEIVRSGEYCEKCALPLGLFSEGYRTKHRQFCKGHGRDNAKYCPWCCVELDREFDARLQHIEGCPRKPSPDAEGPIDTESGCYFLPSLSRVATPRSSLNQEQESRRKSPEAAEAAEACSSSKERSKKPKHSLPPITTKGETPRRTSTGSARSLSPPPSSSHSRRSRESWRPPPTPTPPLPPPPPPPQPPAAPVREPTAEPAQPAGRGKGKGKGKAKTPAKPKKAAAPASPLLRRVTRSMTGASKRKRGDEEADGGSGARPRHTAKAVRTVSYAEPLVRGPSPAREGARGGRLAPAIRFAGVGMKARPWYEVKYYK